MEAYDVVIDDGNAATYTAAQQISQPNPVEKNQQQTPKDTDGSEIQNNEFRTSYLPIEASIPLDHRWDFHNIPAAQKRQSNGCSGTQPKQPRRNCVTL